MDFVLDLADEYVFDAVWAKLVPLSAFSPEITSTFNSTLKYIPTVTHSSWSSLVSLLPHPSIDPVLLSDIYANASHYSIPDVSAWPRDYIPRQLLSLSVITLLGIHALYFLFAGLSYYLIFNHEMMRHPRFLKNQVKLEIQSSLRAFPVMMFMTVPIFQAEVMGYTRLYDGVDTYGYFYLVASVPL